MSFLLSKLVWALLAPGSLLLAALLLAALLRRHRPRLAAICGGVALVFVLLLNVAPIGRWALAPLQSAVPPPLALQLDHVDGIVVLGGAVGPGDLDLTGLPSLNDAAERMTGLVALARRFPDARLVYTGGSGFTRDTGGFNESRVTRLLFDSLGVPPERVQYEDRSRNTWENAQLTQRLVTLKPGETWIVITSAWHMPRALGCFRRLGWDVVPWAVDAQGREPIRWLHFDMARELNWLTIAVREWIGLVSYRLMGRSTAWLPGETRTDFRRAPTPAQPDAANPPAP